MMAAAWDLPWYVCAALGAVLFFAPAGVIWAVLCALARATAGRRRPG